MTDTASFGRAAADTSSVEELLQLEIDSGRDSTFTDPDSLVGLVLSRSLKAEQTIVTNSDDLSISITSLDDAQQNLLEEQYGVAHQHARGAWYVPEQLSLKPGKHNLAWMFAQYPRFAHGLAAEERARIATVDHPAGILLWAVTEPFFDQLYVPLELRGPASGAKSAEDQLALWASFDELAAALGLRLDQELAVMRRGGGWGRLRAPQQLEAKLRLLAALAAQAGPGLAARYRAYRLRPLIARYYEKSKKAPALRRQTLTKPLQATLSGFFGGNWLAFLDYLGEEPNPAEEIVTAIPEVRLFAGGATRAAEVAARTGLPQDEIARALATYWPAGHDQTAATSPVEERLTVLRNFWTEFDQLHSRQASGMTPLWGLVEEDHQGVRIRWEGPDWFSGGLYRKLLSPALCQAVDRCWGTVFLPRWPERIVTELAPHALMADAFGAALRFWHGCALTAWFVSEGPYSRTDMAGLAEYYERELSVLEHLGCPVDAALFVDLIDAESRLGPPQALKSHSSSVEVSPGVRIEVSMNVGTRRPGFERLRDVVTRHRRSWAERYLDPYLQGQSAGELKEAARLHAEAIAERGKPPTPKQFARHAADATNHWLGGDLSAFYAAIGEKSPVQPVRVALMPVDKAAFASRVFETLGGSRSQQDRVVADREEANRQSEQAARNNKLGWLAEQSLRLVQLEEAIGSPPALKQFGSSSWDYYSDVLDPDPEVAWERYLAVVSQERSSLETRRPAQVAVAASKPMAEGPASPTTPPPPTESGPPETSGPEASDPASRHRHWFRRSRS